VRGRSIGIDHGVQRHCVKTELDNLATALHAKTDDLLKASPHLAPLAAGRVSRYLAGLRRASPILWLREP
jgi:hypothetical protein